MSLDYRKAAPVLKEVERLIEESKTNAIDWWHEKAGTETRYVKNKGYRINCVYDKLAIFDWWSEYIGVNKLKDMRVFLREAIKLGYTGHVDFKVGAAGCSNGMWAYTGDSDDGPYLYKSFTPDYNEWEVVDVIDGKEVESGFMRIKTVNELEDYIINMRMEG